MRYQQQSIKGYTERLSRLSHNPILHGNLISVLHCRFLQLDDLVKLFFRAQFKIYLAEPLFLALSRDSDPI